MKLVVMISILVISSCVARAQEAAKPAAQNKNQAPNTSAPAAALPPSTSTKKIRVDRKGFDLDPKRGADTSPQIGAGTRGGPPSTTVLYAPNLGLAYTLCPVFFWNAEDTSETLMFRLYDADGSEIYKSEVTGKRNFTYPEAAPKLKPGSTYQWTVQSPGGRLSRPPQPARFMVLSGRERDEVTQELEIGTGNIMLKRMQQAQVLADHWLWYDSVVAFSDLISDYPEQTSLYERRGNIYKDLPQTQPLAQQDFSRAHRVSQSK